MAVPRVKRGKAGPEAGVLKGPGLEVLCKPCPWVSLHRAGGTVEERQETETVQVRDDSGLI